MNLISFSAILPIMLKDLKGNYSEISLIPALASLGFGLPQIISFKVFKKRKIWKFLLFYLHLFAAIPILFLSLSIFFNFSNMKTLIISGWAIYCATVGLLFPIWVNFLAKTTKEENRGRIFGLIFFSQTIAGGIGVFISGKIYGNSFDNLRSSIIFFLSFLTMVSASTFFLKVDEVEESEENPPKKLIKFKELLKEYKLLIFYFISRICARASYIIVSSFYILNIVEHKLLKTENATKLGTIALFSQAFASLILGNLGDKKGHKKITGFALYFFLLSILLLILFHNIYSFILLAISLGIYFASDFTTFNNLLFSIVKDEDRSYALSYLGFFNTFPQFLLPLICGYLLGITNFFTLYIISLSFLIISITTIYKIKKD